MRSAIAFVMLLAVSAPLQAQTRDRLPWFALDAHVATVGLPTAEGWVPIPIIATDLPLPGRGWGVAAGATVYPFRIGIFTFGFGASMATGSGEGESLTITTGSGSSATTTVTPVVTTRITSLHPQVSINFGHKLGWSYLSAGYGPSKVSSRSTAVDTTPAQVVPEAWNPAINFGGGARWFMKPHLGASFDVRFTKLGSRAATATLPSARRTQVFTISAGISIQ